MQNEPNGHSTANGREVSPTENQPTNGAENQKKKKHKNTDDPFANRQPISEVLRDIYDSK